MGFKRKKLIISICAMIALLFTGVAIYVYSIYQSLEKTAEIIHEPITRNHTERRKEEVIFKKTDPFSLLMLGVDERKGDKGRSDTLIVLSVNPTKQSVQMVSIPRDTRTEIIGRGYEDKINHAYAFGGVDMSIKTIEHFLDIPIDYYIKMNMDGFKDIVNALNGVTVMNDLDFTAEGVHFPKGELSLNGDKALIYSRVRYEDPRGDFGRQLRQRQIVEAIIKKGVSLGSITKYDAILSALEKNIKTNLTLNDMTYIQKNYQAASNQIEHHQLKGVGKKINSTYFFIVSDEEKERIQHLLKNHLQIEHKGTSS
ncbi:LytR family transcriptional regulator [Bacillus aquiflavi]|uniref:Polyisoprenyl-teichoic acid--peptidoglycan teichoic acid transferase TagU n=1 Tax=Bacillus aquiflavi TaxID=2672567 RepID=A0A6B3W214_9BACI|nr:LytR family transcriptional regulator [Bacillus aquiflavi]MBA4538208.1 LytR family transcriptional regulator [Bacillus aquiflavi]NEY82527.1 LytR family transcriptional regulator [Bacillus aquiflavi]UAC47167.1 LytR family transcriptional regulator [Bacillus aquiflavi]